MGRVREINREIDSNSEISHIIIHINAHGLETDRPLTDALHFLDEKESDLHSYLNNCLFFSSTGRGLVNMNYSSVVNYNDPNRNSINNVYGDYFYGLPDHSNPKLVRALMHMLVAENHLVADVILHLQKLDLCKDGLVERGKEYIESINSGIPPNDQGAVVLKSGQTITYKPTVFQYYENVCSGNICSKPMIYKNDKLYMWDGVYDHIQCLDVRNPKIKLQNDLLIRPIFPQDYARIYEGKYEIYLSEMLIVLFRLYLFDYVTIIDTACRQIDDQRLPDLINWKRETYEDKKYDDRPLNNAFNRDSTSLYETTKGEIQLNKWRNLKLGGYSKRHKQKIRKHSKKHKKNIKKIPRKIPRKTQKNPKYKK